MEDEKIVELYWKRSEQAIAETASKYGPYCHYISYNILHSHEDAEECVNDTYAGAWNAMPPTRPRVLRHFLSRIVRNLSFKRYSYLTADKRSTGTQLLLSELEECLPDGRQDLGVQMEKRAITLNVNRFLGQLSKADQGIFVARYFYAVPLAEIAERTEQTPRQIQYRLQKLRDGLRRSLEKEGIAV